MTATPVPRGTLIAGKYLVGDELAAGGMGVVCEGRHATLDQRVAIKFLLPEVTKDAEAIERFLREAKATAKIDSDHVVRILDAGMHEDVPYLVMEFLEGTDLHAQMDSMGPLPVSSALDLITQALEGLTLAHNLGIVHRDLKPSNLFLTKSNQRTGQPRVKVLDFGISKELSLGSNDRALTSTKSLLGSPGYMSPEQVRSSKNVDKRSDVWAMGVILYEMLSGEPAFQGETIGDVFAKIREEPLAPIRTLRPDLSPELADVVMRCLKRDRNERFADAGELLDTLRSLAPESTAAPSTHATPRKRSTTEVAQAETLAQGETPAPQTKTHATWSTADSPKPQRRLFAALGGGLLIVAATTGVYFTRDRGNATHGESLRGSDGSSGMVQRNGNPTVTPTVTATNAVTATLASAEPPPSSTPSATASAAAPTITMAAKPGPAPSATPTTKPSEAPPPTPPPVGSGKKKDDLGI